MKKHGITRIGSIAALAAVATGLSLGTARAVQQPPPRPAGEYGVEVLTRGPVHEAFAETVTFDPEPGIVVNAAPPNPIEEMPPDQRPAGVNVAWIPGYTAWDDERNDYLWVSGVWRAPPPGRQWVSGYWGRSAQGYQWTSGFWADAQMGETEYLPEPPQSVEVGPSIPAPSPNHSWIPGCWIWQHGRYAWRPGYWVTVQSDWDWIPGHYTWTRRGYVFVDGYWDYSVENRGVLFAPVYFDASVYARRGYYYSPSTVISLSVFTDHLFVRPRYGHYYFGDYYDDNYRDAGFYSRFAFQSSRYGYDPIYAHQRWKNRHDDNWRNRVEDDFRRRRDHGEWRPARTLAAQITLNTGGTSPHASGGRIATSLDQLVRIKDSPLRFESVESAEKQQLLQRGKEIRTFREERQKLETDRGDRSDDDSLRRTAPDRVAIPRSPIVGKRGNELQKDRVPPSRHQAPDPDPRIEGKPRQPRGKAGAERHVSDKSSTGASKAQPKNTTKKKSKDDN